MSASTTLSQWRQRGQICATGGQELFFVDEGGGDAVLCLHGFPTASWDWQRLWPGLIREHRAIAPDLLGFGFSAKPRQHDYSLMEQADLAEALLAARGIQAAHLLCHDYGDTVGQELLARAIEGRLGFALRSVTLLNGGIIPGEHRPRLIQRLLAGPLGPLVGRLTTERRFQRSFAAIFGANSQPTEAELADFWSLIVHNGGRGIMHRLIQYMRERERFRDRWVGALQASPVPLRFICGTDDPVSGHHMAKVFAALVPDPDVVLLAGVGHYPQWEASEAVLAAWRDVAKGA